uniref:Uncharacterized protein n=1 Tax=Romanomermis culicivorax TaxID=13658 RepID=A0A915KA55_ROMCU
MKLITRNKMHLSKMRQTNSEKRLNPMKNNETLRSASKLLSGTAHFFTQKAAPQHVSIYAIYFDTRNFFRIGDSHTSVTFHLGCSGQTQRSEIILAKCEKLKCESELTFILASLDATASPIRASRLTSAVLPIPKESHKNGSPGPDRKP